MKALLCRVAWTVASAAALGGRPIMTASAADAGIVFGGYPWTVRSGQGGPGPNAWDARNVWLDAETNLHLRISQRDGRWSCAEVTLKPRLGFGRYEFRTQARLDQLDDNVVLGLFNYPPRDVGLDGTHEIDIEFARWGNARNPIGNFTVWPVERGLRQVTHSFPVNLTGDEAMHWFAWSRDRIEFRVLDRTGGGAGREIAAWTYRPSESARFIAREPMPVHLNLWLFQGWPPKDGREVEVVIRDFRFTPEPVSPD